MQLYFWGSLRTSLFIRLIASINKRHIFFKLNPFSRALKQSPFAAQHVFIQCRNRLNKTFFSVNSYSFSRTRFSGSFSWLLDAYIWGYIKILLHFWGLGFLCYSPTSVWVMSALITVRFAQITSSSSEEFGQLESDLRSPP